MTARRRLFFIASLFLGFSTAASADDAPFSFEARRNSTTSYGGDWRFRSGSALPWHAGITVVMNATDKGAVESVPVTFTGAVGNLEDATPWGRHGAVLNVTPMTSRAEARIASVQPVWIGAGADLELRQSLIATVEGQAETGATSFSSTHALHVGAPALRLSVLAKLRLATGQRGAAANLHLERKVAEHWTVTADFSRVGGETTGGVKARYAFNW